MSTKIEWTDETWNPVTGCDQVSPGCDNCYAERIATRFGRPFYGAVELHRSRLEQPLRWRKSRRVFVNSVSDLFHPKISDEFIGSVWNIMALTPQHTYQILTKRPQRMQKLLSAWENAGWMWRRDDLMWCGPLPRPLPNVWLGVSVENQRYADLRIPYLQQTPAAVRFLSVEPLLGAIDLRDHLGCFHDNDVDGGSYQFEAHQDAVHTHVPIDWVIVGGESGHGARPMHPSWARRLRDQCELAEAPFFFKQWGEWGPVAPLDGDGRYDLRGGRAMANDGTLYTMGEIAYPSGARRREALEAGHDRAELTSMYRVGKKNAGRDLDGRTWDEYPAE